MHDTVRKTGRYSAWTAVGLLILVGGLVLFLQTQFAKDLIRDQVVSRTNEAIAGRLEIGGIGGTLLRTLTVEDVQIYDGRGQPFARLEQLDVEFSLFSLMWGRLDVGEVTLDSPVMVIRRYEDGTLNVAAIAEPSDEKPPPPADEPSNFGVNVESIQLREGAIVYEDRVPPSGVGPNVARREALIEALDATFEGGEPPDFHTFRSTFRREGRELTETPSAAAIEGLKIDANVEMKGSDDLQGEIERLRMDVLDTNTAANPFRLTIDNLAGHSRPDRLGVRLGQLELDESTLIDKLRATLHLDPEAEQGESATGLELASGRLERLHVPTELGSALIPGRELLQPLDLEADLGGDSEQLLARATLRAGDAGSIEIGGSFNPDNARPGYRVSVALDRLQPHRIVDLEGISGTINAGISAQGEGFDPETARARLGLAIWDSDIQSYQIERSRLQASIADGRLQLKELSLRSPLLHLGARGEAGLDGAFDVALRARSPRERASWTPPKGPKVTIGEGRLDLSAGGQLDLEANFPELVQTLDVSADWNIVDLEAGSMGIPRYSGTLDADVREPSSDEAVRTMDISFETEGESLRLPGFELGEGNVSLQGSADVRPRADGIRQALLSSQLDYRVEASEFRMGDNALGRIDATGRLNSEAPDEPITYQMGGDFDRLRTGAVDMAQGNVDLQGDVMLADALSGNPIERINLGGNVRIQRAANTGFSSQTVDLELDLQGDPLAPTGSVSLQADTLQLSGRSFERATLDVGFLEPRSVKLDLEATPDDETPPIVLRADAGYTSDFTRFDLSRLDIGRPGIAVWELARPTTLSLVKGGVSIDRFRLEEGDQSIDIDGTFRTEGAESLTVDVSSLDLGTLQTLADLELEPALDGRLSTQIQLMGTARAPRLQLDVEARELVWGSLEGMSLEMEARYVPDIFRLDSFDFTFGEQTLLTGSLAMPVRWNLQGAFEIFWQRSFEIALQTAEIDFAKLPTESPELPTLPISGQGMVQFDARGTLREPVVELQSSLSDVTYRATLAGGSFDVESLASNLTFRYDATQSDRLALSASVSRLDRQVIGLEFSTRFPIADTIERLVRGRSGGPDWRQWFATHPVDLAIDFGELQLGQLPVAPMTRADAEGELSAEIRLEGTTRSPTGHVSMDLNDFGWNQYRDIFVTFNSTLKDDRVSLERLNVKWDGTEMLRAQGGVPVSVAALLKGNVEPDPPVDLTVELLPFSFQKLSAIDYSFSRFSGDLSGYFDLQGSLRAPEVEARFAAVDARFGGPERGTVGVELNAADNRVEARTFVCEQDRRVLAGYVDVPLLLDPIALSEGASPLLAGELDGRIKGTQVPLQRVAPAALFSDLISRVGGQLDVDATLAGTWDKPRPSGSFEITNGAMTLVDYGRRFENLRLEASLDREALTVSKLAAESLEGSLQGKATVQVEGLYPGTEPLPPDSTDVTAQFQTDQFDISGFAPNTAALITSSIDISGSLLQAPREVSIETSELDVRLPEGGNRAMFATTLHKDIDVLTGAEGRGEVAPEIDASLTTNGRGESNTVRIQFNTSRDSWLRHPSGDLNFKANMGIRLVGSRAYLSGKVDSIRGDFDFLGREFQVPDKEGVVQFTGAYPPDPLLAVEAYHPLSRAVAAEMDEPQSGDPRIIVEVAGRATEPELEMRSDPLLSETEIIFVLMTGRPPSSANPGEDEGAASQAVAAASGVFSGLLQKKLAGTLPVDVLRIQTGEKGFSDSRIKVGKYITSELFVSYSYFFGAEEDESNYEARVEYHFLPRWMVSARYGQNNMGGFDIFWDIY